MAEDKYTKTKQSVLEHMQALFEEMEEEMAMSHQEKYALLEDLFDNASDEDELRVAFDRWYMDHADDIGLDYEVEELWEQALGGEVEYDSYEAEDDDTDDFEEEEEDEDEF